MSPRRSRLRDLLAQSNIAGADIERERLRAERDSKNFATGVGALRDLVPGVAGLYGDTVKRDETQKEKLRLEKREDEQLVAKLAREESREKARVEREAAEKKRAADEAKAERARLEAREDAAKAADRAYAEDKDAAEFNLKGFAQQDTRTKNETDAAIEREKLAAKGKGGSKAAAPKPPKPPPASVNNKLADFDTQISMLEGLAKRKDSVNLGPVDSRINGIAQVVGLDDENTTKFKADTANAINEVISALSGANVPEGEFARLREGLPQANDQDSAFMTKLTSKIEQLRAARRFLEQRSTPQAAPKALETMSGDDLAGLSDDELRAYLGGG